MYSSSELRSKARETLKGKWGIAVLAGILSSILGVSASNVFEFNLEFNGSGLLTELSIAGHNVFSFILGPDISMHSALLGGLFYILSSALFFSVVYFVVGSVVQIGYSRFNLEIADDASPGIGQLFSYFSHWVTAFTSRFLRSIYVFLWSLLFIIPGIVASFSYAMTPYVLAENPELSANEAISRSKEMMRGNRYRLFCLHLSFIGWQILCIFTFNIGILWLIPYRNVAEAAFYRDISGGYSYHEKSAERTYEADWDIN